MSRLLIAAFLTLTVFSHAPATAQTIKLATLAPQGSPWALALQDIASQWLEASNGKVRTRIFAGGVAGDEVDMVRKMRIGQLQAAALTGVGLAHITQDVRALQMPMLLRTDAELDFVRSRIADRLEGALVAKGFRVLNWVDAGWVQFFTSTPVVSPTDLKPHKLFAWVGETAHIDAWRSAGYQPIPLPATEIHTALSSGLITALPTTPVAALAFQWFGQAPHMTDINWAPLIGATVVTERAWKRVPDGLKANLAEQARNIGNVAQAKIRGLGQKAIAVMQQHGLTVHAVPDATVAQWEHGARAGYAALLDRIVPADLVSEVERLRDEYRAAHPHP